MKQPNQKFNISRKGYDTTEVDTFIVNQAEAHAKVSQEQRARIEELRTQLAQVQKTIEGYKKKSDLIAASIAAAVDKADEIEKLSKLKYGQEIARLKAFQEKWTLYYKRILQKYPIDQDLAAAGEFNQRVRRILAQNNNHDVQDAHIPSNLLDTFESENRRLEERQIGYITVQTKTKKESDDNQTLLDMIPDIDLDSPILAGTPIEKIKQYLQAERQRQEESKTKGGKATAGKNETAATIKIPIGGGVYKPGRMDNPLDFDTPDTEGFSFKEALNPQEDLESIMSDLGID